MYVYVYVYVYIHAQEDTEDVLAERISTKIRGEDDDSVSNIATLPNFVQEYIILIRFRLTYLILLYAFFHISVLFYF